MSSNKENTLKENEPHPATEIARKYLMTNGTLEYASYKEAIASSALAGNRLAEICLSTIERLENKEPVSDRYFMGLAWLIWELNK